jgi:hypothetical protein
MRSVKYKGVIIPNAVKETQSILSCLPPNETRDIKYYQREFTSSDLNKFLKLRLDILISDEYGYNPKFGISENTAWLLRKKKVLYLGQLAQLSDEKIKVFKIGIGPVRLKALKDCEENFPPGVKFGMDVGDWVAPK